MPFLTIFSAPKPFTDPHINTIQRNAILSWVHLMPEVEIFLVGDESGMVEAAQDCGVPVLREVRRNNAGTPLVSSIFELARQASSCPYMAYINGDILAFPDLITATRKVAKDVHQLKSLEASQPSGTFTSDVTMDWPGEVSGGPPFLIIGQRWDLDVREPLDYTPGWEDRLRRQLQTSGRLHAPAGSDYFIFPRNCFIRMPDFAIGRAGWDNWMIFEARRCGWPVIDGTPSITIIHQSHDYRHLPGGRPHYDQPESQENLQMGGGLKHMYMILDADKQLRNGKIQTPRPSWLRLIRAVELRLMPENGELRGPRGAITRRLRKLRRKLGREA